MTATAEFIKADFGSTLFPLKTNRLMVEAHEPEVSAYLLKVLDTQNTADTFLPQQRVYATKPKGHLRRTLKLDPVAEYFLYDVCYRNRSIFRPEVSESRRSFGYRFKDGSHISVHSAYGEYKAALAESEKVFKHKLMFDVAAYFNSLYHHDVVHWFESRPHVSGADASGMGQFLREINAGRSVDFLPQGIYPSKMIGSEFLKFVDLAGQVKSARTIRFMDDFALFDEDPEILRQDFVRIQQLLGQYGLNVNPSKTQYDGNIVGIEAKLSEIQESLKGIFLEVQEVHHASGIDLIEVDTEFQKNLSGEQVAVLVALLRDDSLEESDADQILSFLRTHSDSMLDEIPGLLSRFPNLTKHIYSICGTITEKAELVEVLLAFVSQKKFFLEYQLFWIACIVEDHLMGIGAYGKILTALYELTLDFKIARAKVLEIPEQGFGFKEIRGEYLKSGQSDWLSWASAMGTRTLKTAERNYTLDYFSKGSPMNLLIAGCAKKL